jgi:uncharacterized protein
MKKSIHHTYSLGSYKPSRYNIIVNLKNGSCILYNSLTGNRIRVSSGIMTENQLLSLEFDDSANTFEDININVLEFLIQKEFLIDRSIDELQIAREYKREHLDNENLRRVTVILTRKCNLGCTYCFQHKDIGDQPIDLQKVLEYLNSQIIPNGFLQITWFGGEPTLRLRTIYELSDRIIEVCRERNTKYRATISTNAVLLNDESIDLLINKNVTQYQISLDGPENMQELRRPSLNGKSTYSSILKNIKYLIQKGAEVNIKIILDNQNFSVIPELFNDLANNDILRSVKIAIQHTEAKNAARGYGKRFNSLEEFTKIKINLLNKLFERGYKVPEPGRRAEFCAANSAFSTMLDLNGTLFRCSTETINVVGSLSTVNDIFPLNQDYEKLFLNREFAIPDCKTCKVLPICGGGCTAAAEGFNEREICSFYKVGVKDYLLLLEKQDNLP